MNTDLRQYVRHSKGFVDSKLCDTLVEEMKTIEFNQHKFHDNLTNELKTRSGSQEFLNRYNFMYGE